MSLSDKSAKALEMAKHALSVLYATDYFTDEEWMKLDGLVHKGKYVWTMGPAPSNLLDGSPLMMAVDDKSRTTITQADGTESFNLDADSVNFFPDEPSTPPESPATEVESATTYQSNFNSDLLVDCSGRTEQTTQPSTPQHPTPQFSHPSPAPSSVRSIRKASVATKNPDPLTKANLKTVSQSKPDMAELAKEFKRRNGREPKSIGDFYQPLNASHWSAIYMKSLGQGSPGTVKSSIAPSQSISHRGLPGKSIRPLLDVPADTILIAQKGFESPSALKISVRPGDNIRYIKHVSGIMHIGNNLRTNKMGQVSEDVFKDKDGQLRDALFYVKPAGKQGKKSRASRHMSVTSDDLRAGVDRMVEQNAAEWNDTTDDEVESVITQAQRSNLPPTDSSMASHKDWAEEMNAIVAAQSQMQPGMMQAVGAQSQMQPEMMQAVVDGVSQMFEAKFQKLMKEHGSNTATDTPRKVPTGPSGLGSSRHAPLGGLSSSRHALTDVKLPKTQTCWFWEKKTCRFTDEECFDLHAHSDAPAVLKHGRPTWGDLASYKEAQPAAADASDEFDDKSKTMTCWFWANGGCDNSPEDCKFAHGIVPGGIALKPHYAKDFRKARYAAPRWRPESADTASVVSAVSTWRERKDSDATQEDGAQKSEVYKPPHLKSLSESTPAAPATLVPQTAAATPPAAAESPNSIMEAEQLRMELYQAELDRLAEECDYW
ncbi:hypothetical protein PVAG01_08744 [Phlyctema vagabunda]|uniref:C3H1-type domain-containing protein n=1 Tax=Phlyctema vagabunda TaxID=108571 RepID=A0ABR4PAD0_9HELO